jgi:hypothetical protein
VNFVTAGEGIFAESKSSKQPPEASAGFFIDFLFFHREEEGDMSLRNVCLTTIWRYKLYP